MPYTGNKKKQVFDIWLKSIITFVLNTVFIIGLMSLPGLIFSCFSVFYRSSSVLKM